MKREIVHKKGVWKWRRKMGTEEIITLLLVLSVGILLVMQGVFL